MKRLPISIAQRFPKPHQFLGWAVLFIFCMSVGQFIPEGFDWPIYFSKGVVPTDLDTVDHDHPEIHQLAIGGCNHFIRNHLSRLPLQSIAITNCPGCFISANPMGPLYGKPGWHRIGGIIASAMGSSPGIHETSIICFRFVGQKEINPRGCDLGFTHTCYLGTMAFKFHHGVIA